MGIKMFSSSSYDIESKNLPNPDPSNYEIVRHKECLVEKTSVSLMSVLLVEIKYLDCTNYEGNKILVYVDCTLDQLKEQKVIDPHFSENDKYKSPIARFVPTDYGWGLAEDLISRM
jgi:hypothetical protein